MMNQVVGTAIAYLDLDVTGFNSKLGTAWTQLQGIADSSLTLDQRLASAGAGLKTIGSTMTRTLTLPIAGGMALATKKTMDFEEAMSNVQALSGATGDDFDVLREKALELGGSTKFTSKEVADAFSYMALAGWKTEEMLAGISGVLDLAASSNMDLAQASDIVTDYLSAFGKEADYSAHMADMMAYAQANANTTTEQLGEAFGNSAAFMHTAGQEMNTTIALLGKMAEQGLKGSEAGTALSAVVRDIIQNMDEAGNIMIGDVAVAVKDSEGNFRDLIDIIADVNKAVEGMGSAEESAALMTTFTSRSIKGLSILLTEGEDSIRSFREELDKADGTANEISKVMLDNLAGSITYLKSAIDNFLIKVGDRLAPYIRKLADALTEITNKISNLSDEQFDALVKAALVIAALGPILTILGNLLQTIASIVTIIKSVKGAVDLVITVVQGGGAVIAKVAGGIGLIISGLILAVKNFVDMWKNGWDIIKTILELLGIALVAIGAIILGAPAAITAVIAAIVFAISQLVIVIHDHWDEIVAWTKDMVERIKQAFNEFIENVKQGFERVKEFFRNLGNTISQWWNEVLANAKQALDNVINAIRNFWNKVTEIWNNIISIIKGWFDDVVKAVTNLFEKLTESLTKFFEQIIQHMKNAWDNIISTINQIFENISNTVKSLFEGLTNLLKSLLDTVISVINNLLTTISSMIDEFISVIEGIFDRISNVLQQIVNTIRTMVEKVIQVIGELVQKFISTIQQLWDKVTSSITETFQKLVKIIEENIQKVWDFLEKLVERFKKIGALILDKLLEGLKESWNRLSAWFEEHFGYIGAIIDKLKSKMANLIPKDNPISNMFSGSHASGLEYVPYDGYIAQLHKGERVLTKNEAENYNTRSSVKEVGDTINIYTKDDPYFIGREIRKVKKELAF